MRISSQIEQSGRAFSAAEAGVENALQSINSGAITPTGSLSINNLEAKADYSIRTYGGTTDVLVFNQTEENSTQIVWLVDHDNNRNIIIPTPPVTPSVPYNSTIDVCWGSDPNINPAIEVSVYYILSGEYRVAKAAYESVGGRNNNFYSADAGVDNCGGNYRFHKLIKFSDPSPGGFNLTNPATVLLALRIKSLYANSTLAVQPQNGSFNIPKQGEIITSVGHTGTDTVRKIEVINGYKQMPSILDFSLFCDNCIN
jgi:hypothetical protein